MKTLRNLREAKEDYKLAPQVTIAEAFDETDDVGNVLIALNHLASIADDLYAVIGDGNVNVTPDEIDSILSAYDAMSEIHDKYDGAFPMPSQEYDLDTLDVEVQEEVKLQLEELELAEAAAWQATVKTLTGLGFKEMKPEGKQPFMVPQKKISHIWGKNPIYFVILMDDDAAGKPYVVVDSEDGSRTAYVDLNRALADLKKLVKEEVELDEAGPIKRVTFVPGGPMEKDLAALGFEKTKPGKDSYTSAEKIASLYGIPMRAGKFADVFFVVYDTIDKPYGIVDAKGATRYQTMGQAIAAVKSMAKSLKEDIIPIGRMTDSDLTAFLKKNWTTRPQGSMVGQLKSAASVARERGLEIIKQLKGLKEETITEGNVSVDIDTDFDSPGLKQKWVGDLKAKGLTVKFSGASTLVSGPKAAVLSVLTKHYGSKKDAIEVHPELKEDVELTETPGGPSVVQKLKDSRAHFQAKLDSGKFPASAPDLKKIIAKLDAQIKAHSVKKEETELAETPGGPSKLQKLKATLADFEKKLNAPGFPPGSVAAMVKQITNVKNQIEKYSVKKEDVDQLDEFSDAEKRAINRLGKVSAAKAAAEKKYAQAKTDNNKRVLDSYIADVKKAQERLASLRMKKEETELEEAPMIDQVGKTCPKCGKGKYKDNAPDGYVRCDNCGDKAKRFQPDVPLSKTKGGKRILSLLKKEDTQLDEVKITVTKWNLAKGIEGQFRMEVIGQDGSAAAKILDKVLPSAKFALFDDQFGFKTTAERDAASAALVKYYSAIKEWATTELPLGTISEEFDESKFRRLAMTGLVPDVDVAVIIRAMKNLNAGKTLDVKQKNLIATTFQSLIGLVTGDVSVFTKIQGAVKKDAANAK